MGKGKTILFHCASWHQSLSFLSKKNKDRDYPRRKMVISQQTQYAAKIEPSLQAALHWHITAHK